MQAEGSERLGPAEASRRDLVVGVVGLCFVGLAAALVWEVRGQADRSGLEPRSWPLVVLLGMAAAAATCVVKGWRRSDRANREAELIRAYWPPLVATLGLVAVYGVLWQYLHFLTVTPLVLVGLGLLLGLRNYLVLILFAAVLSALVYALFAVGFGIAL